MTIFDSELEYVDHMNQYHARTFHSAQLELLKTKSTCYTGQIFKSCPICGQSKFRDSAEAEGHVAAHLVALASECFPIDEEDNIVLQSMASSYIKLVDVFLPSECDVEEYKSVLANFTESVETAFRSAQAENIKLQDFNKDENHPEVEASLDFGMRNAPPDKRSNSSRYLRIYAYHYRYARSARLCPSCRPASQYTYRTRRNTCAIQ